MDIQRKCFEESNNVNPDWSFKFDEELQQYIALDSEMELQVDEFNEHWDTFRAGWQAAKAQAVHEWKDYELEKPNDGQKCLVVFESMDGDDSHRWMCIDEFNEFLILKLNESFSNRFLRENLNRLFFFF